MTTDTIPTLASTEFVPYIDENGQITEQYSGKIGVYAIFNQENILQFVGYSRDVYLSLKQHIVRQPQNCYWIKVQTIERPNRTILENIEKAWIEENGNLPVGNKDKKAQWTQPIDAKLMMTPEEQNNYENLAEEIAKTKALKNVARRIETQILTTLQERGLQMQIRFNPKLKEEGLLDLK